MWAFAKISTVIIASGQNYLLQKPFKALNDALIISFLEMLLAGHSYYALGSKVNDSKVQAYRKSRPHIAWGFFT